MKFINQAVVLLILFFQASLQANELKLGLFTGYRNSHFIRADEKRSVGLVGLTSGSRVGGSGKSSQATYGFDANYEYTLEENRNLSLWLRAQPYSVQIYKDRSEYFGSDVMLSLSHKAYLQGTPWGVIVGGRVRRWTMSSQDVPDSGQAGLTVAAEYRLKNLEILFEAALLAAGLGGQGDYGIQRDSNSLRLRITKSSQNYSLFSEFFHTHRTFFGGQGDYAGGHFLDEPMFVLGVNCHL